MERRMPFSPMKLALGRRLSEDADEPTSLEEEHGMIEGVLAQIEALADALPALPPRTALEGVILHLREAIPAHCRHEEQSIAAVLDVPRVPEAAMESMHAAAMSALRRNAFELLRAEHEINEAVAHELADAIDDCLFDGGAARPEALGQLARQFFLLMRRHMAWEELVLATLASSEPLASSGG